MTGINTAAILIRVLITHKNGHWGFVIDSRNRGCGNVRGPMQNKVYFTLFFNSLFIFNFSRRTVHSSPEDGRCFRIFAKWCRLWYVTWRSPRGCSWKARNAREQPNTNRRGIILHRLELPHCWWASAVQECRWRYTYTVRPSTDTFSKECIATHEQLQEVAGNYIAMI